MSENFNNNTNSQINEIINDQVNMHEEKTDLLKKLVFWTRIIGIYFLIKILIIAILIITIYNAEKNIQQIIQNVFNSML